MIRHGETVWNQERRIQGGSSDTELSEVGRRQAEKLGLTLKDVEVSAIYSSPLKRAFDTAQAIASHHQIKVETESDLREMEVGELEGVPISELGTSFSQFMLQWRQGRGMERLPGGESVVNLANRVWRVIQHIIRKRDPGTVIVVGHYFVVVVAICKALRWPLTCLERIRVQTGSISIIDLDSSGQSRLTLLGDTCHLGES